MIEAGALGTFFGATTCADATEGVTTVIETSIAAETAMLQQIPVFFFFMSASDRFATACWRTEYQDRLAAEFLATFRTIPFVTAFFSRPPTIEWHEE